MIAMLHIPNVRPIDFPCRALRDKIRRERCP